MSLLEEAVVEQLDQIGVRIQQAFDDAVQDLAHELSVPRVKIRSKLTGRPAFRTIGDGEPRYGPVTVEHGRQVAEAAQEPGAHTLELTEGQLRWLRHHLRQIDHRAAASILAELPPPPPRPEAAPDDIDRSTAYPEFGVSKRRSSRTGRVRHRVKEIKAHDGGALGARRAVTWLCGNYTFSARVGGRHEFRGTPPCQRCEEAHRKQKQKQKGKSK